MYKRVSGNLSNIELIWADRLILVRAYYGLGMLSSDKQKKRALLQSALETAKLRQGEYDPAARGAAGESPEPGSEDRPGTEEDPGSDPEGRGKGFPYRGTDAVPQRAGA